MAGQKLASIIVFLGTAPIQLLTEIQLSLVTAVSGVTTA